jgi:hypothetical protein
MRFKTILAVFAALVLALGSCIVSARDDIIRDFVMNGQTVGNDQPVRRIPRNKIVAYLGKPPNIQTKKDKDFFGATHKITTLKYYDFTITYDDDGMTGKENVSSICTMRSLRPP